MEGKIRVLVVDDEALARRRLLRFLKAQPDVEILPASASGPEAVAAIGREAPDVVFLDVQMPEVSGFEVLAAVPRGRVPRVVFVTAYDEHAVKAFEVGALDYLLKPFDLRRFEQAFARVRGDLERDRNGAYAERLIAYLERIARRPGAGEEREPAPRRLDRLMVKSGGRVFFIRAAEIDWIEAADNYVRVHAGKDTHLLRQTLNTMAAHLDPDQFARVHRSAVVNLDAIREIHQGVGRDYLIVLKDGTELRLSERHRKELEERGRI